MMENLPPLHDGSVALLISVNTEAHSILLQNAVEPYPLANMGRSNARIADDGNYAFYRPTDGLVYPLIQ